MNAVGFEQADQMANFRTCMVNEEILMLHATGHMSKCISKTVDVLSDDNSLLCDMRRHMVFFDL